MPVAVVSFDDLSAWARGAGLEVVLLGVGAVLAARFVRWVAGRWTLRVEAEAREHEETGLAPTESSKYTLALLQAGSWTAIGLVWLVALLMILERLNVPLTSLVAPATVAGVAVGFGAQRVVQDLLAGFFLFAERQYGYGDIIRIAAVGESAGISGTVEEFTLRTTRLRTINGELVMVPNGEIRQVTNLSKGWARVVIDVPVPADEDVERVTGLLVAVGEELMADDTWRPLLLETPSVMGVEAIELGYLRLRFVARTLPARQWDVGRELRRRITVTFQETGISIPTAMLAPPGSG